MLPSSEPADNVGGRFDPNLPDANANVRAWADFYRRCGFAVTKIHEGEKRPIKRNWTLQGLWPEEFSLTDQIAIMPGRLSGDLVCVDLDSPRALELADRYLPPTNMVSGRPSKPRSHRFYRVTDVSEDFASTTAAGGMGGPRIRHYQGAGIDLIGTGGEVVEPPSLHPSGEKRRWDSWGEPAVVDCCILYDAVETLARACGWTGRAGNGVAAGAAAPAVGNRRRLDNRPGEPVRRYHAGLPAQAERVRRARGYLATLEPAVSGQHGHDATFRVACLLVRDFALDPKDAWELLVEYGDRCQPPWSVEELRHKLEDADRFDDLRGDKLWKSNGNVPDHCGETLNDPNRLARKYLEATGTWRYWRDEWWRYDGRRYAPIPQPELEAWLTRCIENVFRADWAEADARAQENWKAAQSALQKGEKTTRRSRPVKARVTRGVVTNALQALGGMTLLSGQVEAPEWVDAATGAATPRPYVAVANGLLDVEAALADRPDALQPHSPEWFSPVCLPYGYDPSADCPTWKKTLARILAEDAERSAVVQEWFGYCLLPDTSHQKFLLMYGEGNNGKSVMNAAQTALLGAANVSHVTLETFGDRFALTPTLGKLANIASEIGELDKAAEGVLKAFTSGERMTFDRKNREPVNARPTARLTLATNNLPRFSDRSTGLWRRMLLMPCDVVVAPGERVLGMDQAGWWERSGQLPGMLNWALEGLRAAGRFTEPAACVRALAEYRSDSNPARAFLQSQCRTADARVAKKSLYKIYQRWCEENGHRNPLALVHFGKEVRRVFPSVKDGKVSGCMGPARDDAYVGLEHVGEAGGDPTDLPPTPPVSG